jgi:8-hydroxy-5-deazaflavin:NADPH oxidoreductase
MTRNFIRSICAAVLTIAAFCALAADPPAHRMKIGIIGSGRIGGTLGELWSKAGYDVMFSSLDLEHDKQLAASTGGKAGTPAQAASYGDVLLVSVPYKALQQIGHDYQSSIKGKVILDTSNPIQSRDGDMAVAAREKGTGVASPELLKGAKVVRAFNSVGYGKLQSEHHRDGDRIAIPLAADDKQALDVAIKLVKDAGFEPVVVGGLATARTFDVGTPVFGKALTAAELRAALNITQ